PGLEEAMDIQAEEASRLGMRMTLPRGSMDFTRTRPGEPPESVVQDEVEIPADYERVLARYHDAAGGAMIRVALAPCALFSVSAALMRDSAELAAHAGCRLHTHLGETRDEIEYCLANFGCRPVDYLEE